MVTWEQRKLGDKITRIKSYSISHGYETMHDTNTKYIHYGDIHTGKVKIINDINILPNIKDNNYIGLNKGDIVVADASEDYKGIADACLVNTDTDSNKIVAGLHTIALRPQKDTYPQYLYTYLSTDIFKHFGYKTGTGLKVFGISYKELAKFLVSSPSIKEQKEISKLISLIEKNIDLQQRKLDELIQIKEGIGQGLLNRHYRNLSIRFNQENSPWKQTKLGKIASFVNGRAFKQKELMNRGLYPVLRVGNFYTNNKWYYSNLNLSPDKYANKGDLLYTWSASFGPHVWKGPKVIYHYHIWKINFDPAVISKAYLYEFLKLDKKEILANSNGSTMIHITKKDMENKMITVPDMNEQIKIGKILEKLDLKIELNKNKLNNLKSVKQFLLQKMFM
ncbi:restriction endonuclease subunit S [Lactobacillus amylovorus]|uniref:restriction endonuclease subunit S n=1 Tax=Lactobacillus amylovorus TaxID=1604 RepID=UPI00232FB8D7|nr:restriction endonuclease subunit S [Lactobacillus amylovorus]MDB6233153.1 restriction endonuclease subunit S [Lactobacillus amylovorus]MDB6266869.1 restriction endonuclease subunit S [Lactobacillus amylovorus]